MNHAKICTILIMTVILLCLFTNTASARYITTEGENAGISIGDTVYLGESNLNFSALAWSGYTVDILEKLDGGYMISLIDMVGSVPTTALTGVYKPYNSTAGVYGAARCQISDLTLGTISITPANGVTVTDAHPSSVPKALDVVFYIKDGDMTTLENQLVSGSSWNYYTLKNTGTGTTTNSITNTAGNIVSLIGITHPTDKTNTTLAFRLLDQSSVLSPTGSTSMEMTFTVNLNGITKTITYPFTATLNVLSISLSKGSIARGSNGNVTLTGIPFTTYSLILPTAGTDTPYFSSPAGRGIVIVNDHQLTITPDWNGNTSIRISVPANATTGSYSVTAVGTEGTKTATFQVTASTMSLIFNEPPEDVINGRFAEGDCILLEGTVSGADSDVPIYLYITGQNLPINGVSLTGTPIVDGDTSTFTETHYSPVLGKWLYYWLTSGFDPGTYTIHANLQPYGYLESSTPTGKGAATDLSWEYPISEQSIAAKYSEKNNGYFAQGDYLYSWWIARGSPGANGGDTGKLRWYIFGNNYHYTDMNDQIPLIDSDKLGIEAPWGEYGFTYNRSFTYTLDPGTYYLVYQHPGADNIFDVTPDINTGIFSTLTTTFGESASITAAQNVNAASILTSMISNPLSDDLYVITEFTIEEPWISINNIGNIGVGDKLLINGTTNSAGSDTTADKTEVSDTFSLKINRLDFGDSETNTAMKIPTDRTTPVSTYPYSGSRIFSFDSIDTTTWYPGTYEAKVTNIDTGFVNSITFTMSGEATVSDSTTDGEKYDPSLSTVPTQEIDTVPTIGPTTQATSTPAQSPGFIFVIPALLLGFVMHSKRG